MQQPFFLNAGGNKKMKDGIMIWFGSANPFIQSITCSGDITIHSTYNGIATTETYSNLNNAAIAIRADINTEVYVEGDITGMSNMSSERKIIIHNTALTSLNCYSCLGLTELNLSANTALTSLDCNSCNYVTNIYVRATKKSVAENISTLIQNAFSSNGTLHINSSDTYASTISDAATAKGWTVKPLE